MSGERSCRLLRKLSGTDAVFVAPDMETCVEVIKSALREVWGAEPLSGPAQLWNMEADSDTWLLKYKPRVIRQLDVFNYQFRAWSLADRTYVAIRVLNVDGTVDLREMALVDWIEGKYCVESGELEAE